MKQIIWIFILLSLSLNSFGADLRGRMGIGGTNQLANGLPALSFKIQRSKTLALGGVLGLQSNQDHTLYGTGVKFYRIIFDEPHLNFYLAGLFATQTFVDPKDNKTNSGYQLDGTMGTEFHFQGLESIGFSFEFGLSARNTDPDGGSSIETLADQLIKAAVHFYL